MDSSTAAFQRMCRTCMMQDQNFHSIYDFAENTLKIYEMLATIAPQLLIVSTDQLPTQVCVVCLNKLNIAYGFQQMCIASEKHMRSMLSVDGITEPSRTITTFNQDPLLAEGLIKLQESIKNEVNELEVKSFDLQQLVNEQPVGGAKSEVDCDVEDLASDAEKGCSESDVSLEEATTHSTRTRSQAAKSAKVPRTSSMHNETGVDEIEKPNLRNRRKGNISCPDCEKVFDRPYRLKRHAGVHNETRPFICEQCKYRFANINQLARHKLTHADAAQICREPPPEGYKCAECPRRFEKRESLSAHIQSHRKTEPGQFFQCDICPKKFRKFTILTKHASTHPENQKFKCTQCDKAFGVNAHLLEHMNKHNGLKPFVCVFCSKAFHQNSTLKEHQRIHTGEKPFLCAQCGKSFQNASNMRQHLLRHSGERRYQCPECPSKFACQSDQIKHMSTHRDIKPHVCDICGSSFTRSYTLNKHKYIHTGERPHKCDECNMTFVFIDHMRRHMRTHTGEKPYKCKFCDRAYAESGDLNKHLRTHVGDKTYKCDQCSEAFKYQLELREHQRLHYKQQKAVAELMDTTNAENPKAEI